MWWATRPIGFEDSDASFFSGLSVFWNEISTDYDQICVGIQTKKKISVCYVGE